MHEDGRRLVASELTSFLAEKAGATCVGEVTYTAASGSGHKITVVLQQGVLLSVSQEDLLKSQVALWIMTQLRAKQSGQVSVSDKDVSISTAAR